MSVFGNYARYYDLLYRDKDYAGEAQFVQQLIQAYAPKTKSILELGCGTGNHALILAQEGYTVHGVDLSFPMLEKANYRLSCLPQELESRITFSQGDIRNVRLNKQFDLIISLFHVISYQTTNADLKETFATIKTHLKPGGIAIFDCWYGPAVLSDRPTVRVKRLEDEAIVVTRIAEPVIYPNDNLVDVNYQVFIKDKNSSAVEELQETHRMRYLFKPEIELLLTEARLELVECKEWMTGNQPGFRTWGSLFYSEKLMKVAVLISQKFPEIGGGYTFESDLLQSLFKFCSESQHSFLVYSIFKELPLQLASIKPDNVKVIYTNINIFKNLTSKVYRQIKAYLQKIVQPNHRLTIETWFEKFIKDSISKSDVDIIWSFTPIFPTMEIPYVVTVWDLQHRLQPYFPEVSVKGEWEMREQLFAKILRRASIIVTGTERGKNEIERFYQIAPERIKILPFPTPQFVLNASLENNSILEKYSIPKNYLFYPAQFWSHKNHIGLLLAVKWLRDYYNLIFPVVFVGSDKGNQAYIKKVINDLDLSQQVYLLGFVPQSDLISLYRQAFALTFVTFFGPDNLPPLEAFALGCPVIASNVPGAKEQLGDAALLVDPKDEQQIALAIKSLYDEPTLRQELVQKGLARASSWTGEDYIKGMLSILDEFEAIRRCWSSGC